MSVLMMETWLREGHGRQLNFPRFQCFRRDREVEQISECRGGTRSERRYWRKRCRWCKDRDRSGQSWWEGEENKMAFKVEEWLMSAWTQWAEWHISALLLWKPPRPQISLKHTQQVWLSLPNLFSTCISNTDNHFRALEKEGERVGRLMWWC